MARTSWRLAALALIAAFAAAPALAADDSYDLHVIIPLTGGGAFLGKAENQALGVVANVINKDGGIHGKKVNLVVHDDQSSPQIAVQLMSEVIAARPAIILGSTISQLCNAQAPLVKESGPVMWCFSPSVRTEPGGWEFTSQIDSHDQQRALMTYFKGKGWKRVALITTTDASGQDAEKSITELGDKLTAEQKSELETKVADIRSALATEDVPRIKSAREGLEQAFHKITTEIYQQAGAGAAPGADYSSPEQEAPGSTGPSDDTIEGEYKEM